jgi:beta-hydroxyacyl-ACP dehydratase FabZ
MSDTILDINDIKKIIPHRYPFLLVDKVIAMVEKTSITAIKNVTANEEFFNGHFPGQPVMPGVLQVEAMAQAGGVLMMRGMENKLVYFMSINNVKFRKPVVPGDTLRLEVEVLKDRGKICTLAGKAYCGDELKSQAEFTAAIVDAEDAA